MPQSFGLVVHGQGQRQLVTARGMGWVRGHGVRAGSVLDKAASRKDLALSPSPLLTAQAHHPYTHHPRPCPPKFPAGQVDNEAAGA